MCYVLLSTLLCGAYSLKLPRIAIWSTFRDNAGEYIRDYRIRVNGLDYPKRLLRFYLVEGDSVDNTYAELVDWAKSDSRIKVIKRDTGLPRHGHDTTSERFRVLSQINNAAIDVICEDNWVQMAMLIESDLYYDPFIIKDLLANKPRKSIVAPMVWLATETSKRFYDIWAYRYPGGEHFTLNEYEWYLSNTPQKVFEVESAGSMLLMDIEVIRSGCWYTQEEVVRGMCLLARRNGYKVFVVPSVHIMHPPHKAGE